MASKTVSFIGMPEPVIYHETPAVVAGVWSDLLFDRWFASAAPGALRALVNAQADLIKKSSVSRFATITLVEIRETPRFDAEMRKVLEDSRRIMSPALKAQAMVMISSGFVAAMLRSILAGITLVTGRSAPHKIFDSVSSAAPWIVTHMDPVGGQPVRAEMIVRLFDSIAREPSNERNV